MAARKCKKLLEELKEANSQMIRYPQTVDEFVEIMQFFASLHENLDNINTRFLIISDLYKLMHEHGIKNTEDDIQNFTELSQTKCALCFRLLLC